MGIFIGLLFVFTAVLLIAVVLVQQPKTAGGLFAGTSQSLLGTSGKTFWTKTTIVLAAIFMLLSYLLSELPKHTSSESSLADAIAKQQQQQAAAAQMAQSTLGNAAAKPAPLSQVGSTSGPNQTGASSSPSNP